MEGDDSSECEPFKIDLYDGVSSLFFELSEEFYDEGETVSINNLTVRLDKKEGSVKTFSIPKYNTWNTLEVRSIKNAFVVTFRGETINIHTLGLDPKSDVEVANNIMDLFHA